MAAGGSNRFSRPPSFQYKFTVLCHDYSVHYGATVLTSKFLTESTLNCAATLREGHRFD